MSARSRGRPSQIKDDANEERELWRQVQADARQIDNLVAELEVKHNRLIELQEAVDNLERRGETQPISMLEELVQTTRECIKLNEMISEATDAEAEGGGDQIIQKLQIFKALREQSEADQAASSARASSSAAKTGRSAKRGKIEVSTDVDRDSIVAESPGGPSSSKVALPSSAASRLLKTGGASRSASVPAAREPSVKVEEMEVDQKAPTPTPSNSTIASASGAAPSISFGHGGERARLVVGTEVFFRHSSKPHARGKPAATATAAPTMEPDGEGILCSVTSVIGEGKQRRYEIRDVDDSAAETQPWRASVSALVPIPSLETNDKLPVLGGGRQVLALYPGTTTFYKAEVAASRAEKKGRVKLRFEGEDDINQETEVERRYVLPDPAVK